MQVVRLRAGIHKALQDAPNNTLNFAMLGEAVRRAMGLPFLAYANRGEEPPLAHIRRNYDQCFEAYLLYRAIADLRRSWRIILPNLEQCALLGIEYLDLEEVAAVDGFWQDLQLLCDLSVPARFDFLRTILDFFRLEYAVHSENYLTHSRLKENEKQFREMLRPPWTLDEREDLREPYFIRLDPLHRQTRLYSKSMGPASSLGKFIKQYCRQNQLDVEIKGEGYHDFVLALMKKLEVADYLKALTARNESNVEVPIYRLKIEKIIWRLCDGVSVRPECPD